MKSATLEQGAGLALQYDGEGPEFQTIPRVFNRFLRRTCSLLGPTAIHVALGYSFVNRRQMVVNLGSSLPEAFLTARIVRHGGRVPNGFPTWAIGLD